MWLELYMGLCVRLKFCEEYAKLSEFEHQVKSYLDTQKVQCQWSLLCSVFSLKLSFFLCVFFVAVCL
jgi:hypothetical protein